MKHIIIFVLVTSLNFAAYSQTTTLTGHIYSSETGLSLHGAHIYWDGSPTQGTISNEDGVFQISIIKDSRVLIISHMGYETVQYEIANNNSISISMSASLYELPEVSIVAMNANSIMKNVISKLEENHPAFPVFYNFYHREIYFSADSTIHFMEEHTGLIEHRVAHFGFFGSKVALFRSRIGYFTMTGRDMFENHRLMSFSGILWDNPVFSRSSHLHRRRSRHFDYKFVGMEMINDIPCFVIDFKTNRPNPGSNSKGRLYIDTSSFAIVREVLRNSSGTEVREINFVKFNEKWYLNSVLHYKSRLSGKSYRMTIYNVSAENVFDHEFSTMGRLLPGFVKEKTTYYDDDFWDEFKMIPLPNWITKRIKGASIN